MLRLILTNCPSVTIITYKLYFSTGERKEKEKRKSGRRERGREDRWEGRRKAGRRLAILLFSQAHLTKARMKIPDKLLAPLIKRIFKST